MVILSSIWCVGLSWTTQTMILQAASEPRRVAPSLAKDLRGSRSTLRASFVRIPADGHERSQYECLQERSGGPDFGLGRRPSLTAAPAPGSRAIDAAVGRDKR